MAEFVTVAKVGEIAEGKGKAFVVEGREIAIFLVGGRYYALNEDCPHMGAPLSVGDIWQDNVVCARHMWAFRLSDGQCLDVPTLKAQTFPVRVEADQIQVQLDNGGAE